MYKLKPIKYKIYPGDPAQQVEPFRQLMTKKTHRWEGVRSGFYAATCTSRTSHSLPWWKLIAV